MCDLGARRIRLLARSSDRAADAAAAVAAHPAAPTVEVDTLADGAIEGDVVVATIPAEAQDGALVARCADVPVIFEVVYDPWPTPLAAAAGDRVLVSGLDLLVHQAVLQFELFTGVPAPLAAMRAAGEAELAARQSSS
jgi:shikimate dehydrogenase